MSKFWKNVAGIIAAPFTAGTSLLATPLVQDMWDDYTGKSAQEEANKANIAEAEKNRTWQEQMSNTAYQRQAQDLQRAGLNPVAATSLGGASTGAGAQATVNPEPSDAQGLMNVASTGASIASGFGAIGAGVNQMAQAAKTSAETPFVPKQQQANIANTTADTIQKQATAQNLSANTEVMKQTAKQISIDNMTREEMNRVEIQVKQANSIKEQQEAISKALQNAYNKATGTTADQSTIERISSIALKAFVENPIKGINNAINYAIQKVQNQ